MTTWNEPYEGFDLPRMFKQFLNETGLGGPGSPGRGRRPGPRSGDRCGPPWMQGDGGKPFAGFGDWGKMFGGFGGFGGHGGPPWARGPRAGRGDVRSAILALLSEEPMHGYQMITEIGRRSGGTWKPSPGSVYPTLQQLQDEGLVLAEDTGGRRVFRLTEEGARLAADRTEEFAELWRSMAPSDEGAEIGELVFGVAAAFMHVMRTGTPDEVDRARHVLSRTRTDLYRILGDDEDSGADSAESDAGSGTGVTGGDESHDENRTDETKE